MDMHAVTMQFGMTRKYTGFRIHNDLWCRTTSCLACKQSCIVLKFGSTGYLCVFSNLREGMQVQILYKRKKTLDAINLIQGISSWLVPHHNIHGGPDFPLSKSKWGLLHQFSHGSPVKCTVPKCNNAYSALLKMPGQIWCVGDIKTKYVYSMNLYNT